MGWWKEILVKFYGLHSWFSGLWDSCIILWQATGLAICCVGVLNPSVNIDWKTVAEWAYQCEAVL